MSSVELGQSVMTLVAFIVLMYVIYRFAWGPIMQILDERQAKIQQDLQSAEAQNHESQAMSQQAQAKLLEAQTEAATIIEEAKAQAVPVKNTMIQEAQAEIQTMKDAAKRDIERERDLALQSMDQDVTRLSLVIAEKIIQRELTDEDHRRLIEDYIRRLAVEVHE